MRAVIQRVTKASVRISNEECASIGYGLLVLLGVGAADTPDEARLLWDKMKLLRIFEDECGKANRSLLDVQGQCLVISQFTLYAECRKGRRPSFAEAKPPKEAKELYDLFLHLVEDDLGEVSHGEFGAMMEVTLVNDGPFTIYLDTADLKPRS